MELELKNGDYVPDGIGGLQRVSGVEALVQQVLFRLTARRDSFPFQKNLGSRLWQLGRVPASQRQAAATQYVAEALSEEPNLEVKAVELLESGQLTVEMVHEEETFAVTLEVRGVI